MNHWFVTVGLMGFLTLVACGRPGSVTEQPRAADPPAPRVTAEMKKIIPVVPQLEIPPPETGLDIGMVAPEILGVDVDGVEFRLSDYRGKVVVLDFWGDW